MGKYKDIVDTEIQRFTKQATYMKLDEEIARTPELQLESHFGGYPYFEEGDTWPTMKDGTPLDFVFQVFNKEEFHLPDDIKLIQFFANTTKPAWEDGQEGYEVRIFSDVNLEKRVTIDIPEAAELFDCAKIIFENRDSLPGDEDADELLIKLNNECELEFEEEMEMRIGEYYRSLFTENHFGHRLGGYGAWLQYAATPTENSNLLFQIDMGWNSFYVFRNEKTSDIEYAFQCA